MIYTVTLNPAIDKTITVNHFMIDKVNQVQEIRYDVGGKGINVSKMIHSLQGSSTVCSIIGGET